MSLNNTSLPASSGDDNLAGIAFLLAGVFVLTIMDVIAKLLVEAAYSPFQILAIRGWIITFSFLGWTAYRGQLVLLKTDRVKHHAVRGLIGFGAPFLFFTALGLMPLADTIVVAFAAPFIMTALSIPLLKESVGRHRWTAIVVGFVGVVIVVQPGGGTFQVGALYALGACLSYSLINIMTRWMSATESPVRLVFYFNFATAIIGTCALPFVWKAMPFEDLMILFAMAVVAVTGHILMTTAFTKAPLGVVAPFEYSALIWSSLFGFVIWGDFPSRQVWLGAGIIVVSGIYMIHREAVKKSIH
jgi:drug/metabolite transporter (DMT)-like permease